jgi:sulfate/thiosulfate transport system substrate-binding protein
LRKKRYAGARSKCCFVRRLASQMRHWLSFAAVLGVVAAFGLILAKNIPDNGGNSILNVSYDPTRELYQRINAAFEADYARHTGRHLRVIQSHGGSSRQSQAIIAGEEPADVVTLGLFSDVDALRKRGLIATGWADRLPNHSQPYTSTIVFVVRQRNPKQIRDWPDLVHPGVEIITPNPRTSGNGKLSALAAWGAIMTRGGTEVDANSYLVSFYQHVRVLDAGARGAATTFALAEIGDVHLTWENEAIREVAESNGTLQIVYPPVSILAEPYVAWVDANVGRHGNLEDARSYLEFLFSDAAQQIIAELGYRPYKPQILHNAGPQLPSIVLFPITAIAHDWDDAQQKFFADNGIIDSVLKESRP